MTSLRRLFALVVIACSLALTQHASAYSLLTHEQLIDLTWDTSIVPLLLTRYPNLTPQQIEHARAYAYGGCVIQDIGYYPFGDKFFSDLTHYVRSGDFVVNLFRNAGSPDELAFAIGALSHYIGDSVGHPEATNLAVPIEFPKLGEKYGRVVNYAEGEHQHVQTEFAFDIDGISHQRFAPVHYLRHVGLQVPTRQLSLAFYQTYGLREDFSTTHHQRINIAGYRFAVYRFIPRIAYAVELLHRKHEPADVDNADLRKLTAEIAAVAQKNNWDTYRKHNGIGTYTLAGIAYILPKVGPFKLLAVKGPSPQTETEYIHSVVLATNQLKRTLHRFTPPPATNATAALAAAYDAKSDPEASPPATLREVAARPTPRLTSDPRHPLTNRDLDTGYPVRPSGYRLTDDTYATLLHRLTLTPTSPVPPGVRLDVLAYYANIDLPFATKKNPTQWANVQKDLITLTTMPTSNLALPYPTYGEGDDSDTPDTSPETGSTTNDSSTPTPATASGSPTSPKSTSKPEKPN